MVSHFQKLLPAHLVVADRLTLSNSSRNGMVLREMSDGFVLHAWLLKSLAQYGLIFMHFPVGLEVC